MSLRAKAHMYFYKKSNGRMFAKLGNAPVCLLTTTGRTSRLARTVPLVYLADGNRIVLVASNTGEPGDPQWYRNIVADQNVTLEIDGDARAMHAVPATPEERERLWPLAVAQYSRYGEEAKRTDREFPVVICTWVM